MLGSKTQMTVRFVMIEKTQESSAARRLFTWSVLTFALAGLPASSTAAEEIFSSNPIFALPTSLFGGETRVVAANPARARYPAVRATNIAPEGRLRLRPVAFRGL